KRLRGAKQFYIIIVIATLAGMLINFLGINPIAALFWTAVINGVLAPPLLVLLMLIANNPKVMGEHVNGRWLNLGGWITTLVMSADALAYLSIHVFVRLTPFPFMMGLILTVPEPEQLVDVRQRRYVVVDTLQDDGVGDRQIQIACLAIYP